MRVLLLQDLVEILGQLSSTEGDFVNGMRDGVAFIDRHGMGHTITGINNGSSRAPSRVKGQYRLVAEVELWYFKFVKPITFRQ